jgi:hypothetical protein
MAARARGSDATETAQLAHLHRQAHWLAIQCAPALLPPRCTRNCKFRASLLRRKCLQSKPKALARPTLPPERSRVSIACSAVSGQAPGLRVCPMARSRRSNLQQRRFPALAAIHAQRWRQFHRSAAQRGCVGNSSSHCSQRMLRADCSAALTPTPEQLRRQRFH